MPAPGLLLVATPSLDDPNFAKTVVLLVDVTPDGALGLIINRPLQATLGEVLEGVSGSAVADQQIFGGGPVSRRNVSVVIRAETQPAGARTIVEGLHLGTTRRVLNSALKANWRASRWRVFAGYAGWGPQQLQGQYSRRR